MTEESDELERFEFPLDQPSPPEEVRFAIESQTYPVDFEQIIAVLTNASTSPNYFITSPHFFYLVKQIEDSWILMPSIRESGFVDAFIPPLSRNREHIFEVVNVTYTPNPIVSNIFYVNGLAPGIYRIVADQVRLTQYINSNESIWSGMVWAEFEIIA